MKKILILSLITAVSVLSYSCASKNQTSEKNYEYDENEYYAEDSIDNTETVIIEPEMTDDFIGDYDPIELDRLMTLKKSGKTLKANEIKSVYLVPRSNNVELSFRSNVNQVIIILNKAEREKILEACNTFLKEYDEKTLKHQKINSQTAYFNSTCSLWYGVVAASIGCSKNDYFVNYEFFEKRPYLLIKFMPSRCDKGDDFTPLVSLYMSPSQIRTFISQMNQDALEAQVKTLNDKAYTY